MSIAYIVAGLVFLFNPHINIIDILPDAAGYGLILYGILRLSHVNAAMSEAAARFKTLLILSLCKLPCLYVYAIVTPEEQIWILLLSLSFGVAEAVLAFLAFRSMFESISEQSIGTVADGVAEKLPSVRLFTLIYMIVKPVMAILPDLTLLIDDRYGVVSGYERSLKSFRGLFNIFSFVITLIIGTVWLICVVRYFKALKKEKAFFDTVDEKIKAYESIDNSSKFRYLITTLSFLIYAIFLCLELKLEGYSLLPPFVNAALFAVASFLLYRFYRTTEKKKIALTAFFSSLGYLVFSTVGFILAVLFTDNYYHEDVGDGFASQMKDWLPRNFEASDDLLIVNLFVLLAQIAFGIMMVMLFKLICDMIQSYGGNPETSLDERDVTPEMRERDAYADKTQKALLHKGERWFWAASILTAISSALFPMLQIYFNEFFMIDLIVRVIFVAISTSYVAKIRHGVKVKARLDFE